MPLSYPYTRINAWSDTSSPRSYTSILSDSTIDYNDQLSIQSHECLTASFHTFGVSSEQAHDPTLLSSSFNAARTPNLDESTTSTETVLGHSCRSHLTPSRSFLDMLPSPASQNSILPGDTPRVEDTSSPSIKPEETTREESNSSNNSQRKCTSSAKECNFWKQEFHSLLEIHRLNLGRLVETEAQCQRLQNTIDLEERRQRIASIAPFCHSSANVGVFPKSSDSQRPVNRQRSKTTTSPISIFQPKCRTYRNTTAGTLDIRRTPSFIPTNHSERTSFSSIASRSFRNQATPTFAYYSRKASVQFAIPPFRNSFATDRQHQEIYEQPRSSTSPRTIRPSNTRSQSEGTLGLYHVADEEY